MRFFSKLVALATALLMILAAVPVSAAGTGSTGSGRLTAAEIEARSAALEDFSARLYSMKQTYADMDYASKDASDPYATARIIVKSAHEVSAEGALAVVSGYNDWHVIQYATGAEAEAALKQFEKMNGVEWVQPDRIMKIDAVPGSNSFKSWGYGEQHVDAFNYNEWLYQEAGNNLANLPTITVAVIDTGASSTHPFIMNRLVPGWDFVDNDNTPEDGHYHGTHVSGTVVDGTFENVKIMPIRVLNNSGQGDETGVASGMEYAYLHGCQVENLSLGGDCDQYGDNIAHPLFVEVIDNAFDNGTTVCVAAGNESDDANNHCPANVPRAFTVASITSSHSLSWFSNYGDLVDIAAPGSGILSSVPGGGYDTLDGTSMATPHVSAACAMVRSYFPDMDADDVVNVLKSAAVDIGISNAGTGMLNVTDLFKFDSFVNAEGQSNHFTSNGTYVWNVENGIAASGNAGHHSSSSVLTTKLQLGAYQAVTFEVKVSSEQDHDFLKVKADGETLYEISGEHDWQTVTVTVPGSGYKTVTWEFIKDGSGSSGSDKAWIRNVSVARTVSTVANLEGRNVEFTTSGAYPWVVDDNENAARSAGNGPSGTSSAMSASIMLTEGMRIGFRYKVSSYGGTFKVLLNGQQILSANNNTNGYSDFEYTADTSGWATIIFKFDKADSRTECAWVKEFAVGHVFASAACAPGMNFDFQNESTFPWEVVEDYVGSTNQNQNATTSLFLLSLEMEAGETFSFRYKVSSESNYDWFCFYVDNTMQVHESGVVGWTEYTFTANTTKTYQFKWSYEKDYSVSSNDDRAYVDDISYSGQDIPQPEPPVPGDADMDGEVTMADALLILRCAMGLIGQEELNAANADYDGNGQIDMADALETLRKAMGLI